jgi:hypothetical protein
MLDLGQAVSPWAPTAFRGMRRPQEGAGGPHRRWLASGRRAQASTEEPRPLWRVHSRVCSLAAMPGLHGEGWASPKGHPRTGPEVGEPIAGKHPRDSHDEGSPRGSHDLEQSCRTRWQVAMPPEGAVVVKKTDVQGTGMPSKTPRKLVLLRVESPEVSSALRSESGPLSADHRWSAGEGASRSINRLEPTTSSVRCAPVSGSGSGVALASPLAAGRVGVLLDKTTLTIVPYHTGGGLAGPRAPANALARRVAGLRAAPSLARPRSHRRPCSPAVPHGSPRRSEPSGARRLRPWRGVHLWLASGRSAGRVAPD